MKTHIMTVFLTSLALSAGLSAAEPAPSVGVVNFMTCITDSKMGKQEQSSFEALKKQMTSLVEETEKQLTAISGKLNDKEYLDSLSPEAEEELKGKLNALNDDLGRYQNQYYQVLNQANMKLVQVMQTNINSAAERVAKEKKSRGAETSPLHSRSLAMHPSSTLSARAVGPPWSFLKARSCPVSGRWSRDATARTDFCRQLEDAQAPQGGFRLPPSAESGTR